MFLTYNQLCKILIVLLNVLPVIDHTDSEGWRLPLLNKAQNGIVSCIFDKDGLVLSGDTILMLMCDK